MSALNPCKVRARSGQGPCTARGQSLSNASHQCRIIQRTKNRKAQMLANIYVFVRARSIQGFAHSPCKVRARCLKTPRITVRARSVQGLLWRHLMHAPGVAILPQTSGIRARSLQGCLQCSLKRGSPYTSRVCGWGHLMY